MKQNRALAESPMRPRSLYLEWARASSDTQRSLQVFLINFPAHAFSEVHFVLIFLRVAMRRSRGRMKRYQMIAATISTLSIR